jgi:hypothetical protein
MSDDKLSIGQMLVYQMSVYKKYVDEVSVVVIFI